VTEGHLSRWDWGAIASGLAVLVAFGLQQRRARGPRLDPTGTALVMIGTGLIVYPVTEGHLNRWDWGAIAIGLAVLVAFGLQQRRARGPLLELSLFTGRAFPAARVTSTLFFAATTGLTLVVVLYLQLGLGLGVLAAGLTLLPWSVGLAVASLLAGSVLVPRYGRRIMFVGLGVLLAGVLAASHATGRADLLVPLGIAGLGMGLFAPAFFTTALKPLRGQEIGSASGLLNAVQQLGATLGVAVLGSVYLSGSLDAAWLCAAGLLAVTALPAALQ